MEQGGEGGEDFSTTAITVTGTPEDIVAIGMLFTQDITTQRKIPGCWRFNNSLAMHMYIVHCTVQCIVHMCTQYKGDGWA